MLIESSETPEPEPLNDYELAAKLSCSYGTDHRIKSLLDWPEWTTTRRAWLAIDRMIQDRRFEQFADEFVSQWLGLHKFDVGA
ncbi:MAG: DUF1592 domain-containing protein [Pirellulaceae bacterium]